ncbi:DUF2061 domain-containing protein [Idiomarina aminovorans]|uniref:DUF2061 domain-containing protein n=1 Tax=Idiomarina aminovorans TaxID=2914829 RepID=UPI00200681C1|nr:DUF2061 domain-containing protein [Idiomarina sp. ATCH4]MCK7460513.1 DUF2061 domain-containing protein [Idiomarina sp. ATCH4]
MKDAVKTVSFGIMHFIIAFGVVWLMTGDIVLGGAIALIEPLVNTVGYYFHEKIWQRGDKRRAAIRRESTLLG